MSEDHFRVIYEGVAVEDGEMDVAQLAPSLLALGKLVEAVDALASGESGRVRVKVRADVHRGSETIEADEATLFQATGGSDPTNQSRFQGIYQIKRLYFERGKKWRLSNSAQTILAEVQDEEFWRLVEAAQVSFTADDYLVCEVRMDQWFGAGLRTEYVVERVLQHIPAPKQGRLPGT